jgi:dihydroorotate dehydrogenase
MRVFTTATAVPGVSNCLTRAFRIDDTRLNVELFGLQFANPLGLAAGFDKQGYWFNQLAALGFGHIEVGTVTGQPQPGNPQPRLFRLRRDSALINRMGFNSSGCVSVAHQLAQTKERKPAPCVIGINIGKSKVVALQDAPGEHQFALSKLFACGDYFSINVSSPNTPNLRELQNRDHLVNLIAALNHTNQSLSQSLNLPPKPLLLKISPDLSQSQLAEIGSIARQFRLQGLIATNTTVERPNLRTPARLVEKIGAGGLSGKPLTARSRQVVAFLYRELRGEIPLIGVGGIMNGHDAWQMIAAGASLIQVYTGFVYGGPSFPRNINLHLRGKLDELGLSHIQAAVGIDADAIR